MNSVGKTFLKKNSASSRILESIKANGGISIGEAKTLGTQKTYEGALCSLFKRNYIKRFDFYSEQGFIYFLDASEGFRYGLKRGLIPLSSMMLFERIKKNGAVSSLELRDIGLPQHEINWFYQKLVRAKMLKSCFFGNFLIFYDSEERLEEYQQKYKDYLDNLVKSYGLKSKRRGQELEKLVAGFYKSLGFDVETNKFFTDSNGNKFEIDILALKPELMLMIAVECKNYEARCLGPSIFLKIAKIKDVMPRALIHIYAKHISNELISNRGFWNQYKDVWLFSTKHIHSIQEKMNPEKVSP